MQCPQCKSDNVQKLSIIYESGTHQINTTSHTIGGGIGSTSGGVGTANTHTTGQSQSLLAQKSAPPKKKSLGLAILVLFVGVIFLFMAMGGSNSSSKVFIASIPVSLFLGFRAFKYNREVYPGEYQNWLKMWHCHKCGAIYSA